MKKIQSPKAPALALVTKNWSLKAPAPALGAVGGQSYRNSLETHFFGWKKGVKNIQQKKKNICFLGSLEAVLLKAEAVLHPHLSIQYSCWHYVQSKQSSKLVYSNAMYSLTAPGRLATLDQQFKTHLVEKAFIFRRHMRKVTRWSFLKYFFRTLSLIWFRKQILDPFSQLKFSKHRPSGPMLSISRDVHMFVCLCVCLCVHFWGTV